MDLCNTKQLFKNALKGNYAIGAFNFVNMEGLKAILDGAKNCNSPVIVQCSTGAIKYATAKTLSAMVKSYALEMASPICLNLDHGKSFLDCKNAIDNGFTNVMIDASSLSLADNIALTKEVVEYAHLHGVTVEAELGVLAGVEDNVSARLDDACFTNPNDVVQFIKSTNVDSLAIAIGTSHGTHKFSGESTLRFDILKKIQNLVPDFPFVLHGASSIPENLISDFIKFGGKIEGAKGVDENLLKKACKMNICKVNVDSDLRLAYTVGIRQSLLEHPENIDIRNYSLQGMKYIQQLVEHKISDVFLSKNKG